MGDKIESDYEVIQYVQAFVFFKSIVQNYGGIHYESAESLGYGALTYITAKLPECIEVGRSDLIDQYLFMTSKHDVNFSHYTSSKPPFAFIYTTMIVAIGCIPSFGNTFNHFAITKRTY